MSSHLSAAGRREEKRWAPVGGEVGVAVVGLSRVDGSGRLLLHPEHSARPSDDAPQVCDEDEEEARVLPVATAIVEHERQKATMKENALLQSETPGTEEFRPDTGKAAA